MSDKRKTVLKSSVWMLVTSWYTTMFSAFSILILTRNLDKHDFGIIAGCLVVHAFFVSLSNVGSETYLVKKIEITEDDINSAWTVNFLTKSIVAIILFFIAQNVANFLKIPELEISLKVMCLSAFFMGIKNPALIFKVKKLDYSQVIILNVFSKTISSLISIVIAINFKSYWAVVFSEVFYHFTYNLGSHFLVNHRVRFYIKGMGEQWVFSKWVLLRSIANQIRNSVDKVIVSRVYTPESLGLYDFSKQSSFMAFNLLISPLIGTMNPNLSDCSYNKTLLVDKMYKYFLVISSIYLPVMFGGMYLSDLIVPVVFGKQWIEASELFSVFMSITFSSLMYIFLGNIFTLIGEVKILFIVELFLLASLVFVLDFFSNVSIEIFAMVRVVFNYFSVFIMILIIRRLIPVSIFYYFKVLSIPFSSSVIMILFIDWFENFLFLTEGPAKLICIIFMGGLCYLFLFVFFIEIFKFRVKEYKFIHDVFFKPTCNFLCGFIKY
jgi:lipopolysaccharide exporter